MGDQLTLKDVYDIVDKRLGEVNQNVMALRNDFMEMEKGRLTALERKHDMLANKFELTNKVETAERKGWMTILDVAYKIILPLTITGLTIVIFNK